MKHNQIGIKKNRLISLDVLRGFNMFWIVGAEQIANALKNLNFPGTGFLVGQLNHANWIGFTFYDLIYPMFIFVVGVSAVFAIKHRQEKGQNILKIVRHIIIRTLLLFLIGLYMSNSGLNLHGWLTNIRWMGVLQRIAICYFVTASLVLLVKPRYQIGLASIFLIGYYLLLRFVPAPGFGAGVWNIPTANLASYFDSLFLLGRRYYHTWDVEGLLSTFPAITTCLCGAFTGYWLKGDWRIKGKLVSKEQKAIILAIIGALLVGGGLLWSLDFPIIKKIWTSSYVLLTAGLSGIILACFYWIIDIKGRRRWAFPFVVIGMNSIFIYVAVEMIPFATIARWITGEQLLTWAGAGETLCLTMVSFLIEWLVLYTMYRRKMFLRI